MPKSTAPDLSEFEALAPAARCGCWFRRISEDQRSKVVAAHEGGYSAPTIAQVVKGWGTPVSATAVRSHFNGDCRCG